MKLNPYLSFNGKCRQAMTFYKNCFGGKLEMQTFGESPMASQFPKEMQDKIIHAMLETDDFILMGTDMQGPTKFVEGTDFSLCLNFEKEADIKKYYQLLSEGGSVIDELGVKFWGNLFGVVRDKFGKEWMMDCPVKE